MRNFVRSILVICVCVWLCSFIEFAKGDFFQFWAAWTYEYKGFQNFEKVLCIAHSFISYYIFHHLNPHSSTSQLRLSQEACSPLPSQKWFSLNSFQLRYLIYYISLTSSRNPSRSPSLTSISNTLNHTRFFASAPHSPHFSWTIVLAHKLRYLNYLLIYSPSYEVCLFMKHCPRSHT